AGSPIKDKIESIRDYYQIKKTSSGTRRDLLAQKVEAVKTEVNKARVEKEDSSVMRAPVNLIPVTLQATLYAGICFFNFYLITYWLSPFIQSLFICLGLYTFGLFSVFVGRSILYNPAEAITNDTPNSAPRERWKIYFEEFAVPLVVALFIAILPVNFHPINVTTIAAVLFFLLFLLSGKGLVN